MTSFRNKILPIMLSISTLATGFATAGCGDNNSSNGKVIADAVESMNLFLSQAKDEQNFTVITNQPNVYAFTYYGDVDKFRIDYADTFFYGVVEENNIFKISQSDDLSWHKSTEIDDLRAPKDQIQSLISKLNALSWTEYNSKTKTLKCELADGMTSAKLIDNELTVNIVYYTDESEKSLEILVKDVGSTNVTLPENIVDDTQ